VAGRVVQQTSTVQASHFDVRQGATGVGTLQQAHISHCQEMIYALVTLIAWEALELRTLIA